jgi:predicted PurR-regulated permease PerM
MATKGRSPLTTGTTSTSMWSGALGPLLIILTITVGLSLAWYNASSLLLLFAGILFAAFLDACTHGLSRVLPIARIWRFAFVGLVLGIITALAITWGVGRLPEQARSMVRIMDTQIDILESSLTPFGIDLFGSEGRQGLSHLISDPGRLFGHVHQAVTGAYAVVINTIIVVCLGLFFAANPGGYRDGMLSLLPVASRGRIRDVMDEMGRTLRGWLLGQLVRNSILAVSVGIALHLLGLPSASLLGLQAGIANFIPYLGPLLAAGPVALVAMPLGPSTLVWTMVIYFSIQTLEGFVVAPLIQREAVNVPPAWTLLAIVVFGAMFGAMGIALAAPLLAVSRIAVLRLYVEDWLQVLQGDASPSNQGTDS